MSPLKKFLLALVLIAALWTRSADAQVANVLRIWPPGEHTHPWWPRPFWPRFACPVPPCFQVCDTQGCDCYIPKKVKSVIMELHHPPYDWEQFSLAEIDRAVKFAWRRAQQMNTRAQRAWTYGTAAQYQSANHKKQQWYSIYNRLSMVFESLE